MSPVCPLLFNSCSIPDARPRHAARARAGRGWLSFAAASLRSIRSDHVRSNSPDFCCTRNDRTACPVRIRQRMPLRFMRWTTSTLFAASTTPDPMPMALSARAAQRIRRHDRNHASGARAWAAATLRCWQACRKSTALSSGSRPSGNRQLSGAASATARTGRRVVASSRIRADHVSKVLQKAFTEDWSWQVLWFRYQPSLAGKDDTRLNKEVRGWTW